MRKSLNDLITTVDDFYEDPYAVRASALEKDYAVPPSQINEMSLGPIARYAACSQDEERIALSKIAKLLPQDIDSAKVEFRYVSRETIKRQICHADGANYAGIVCLTPPDLCQGGTFFYQHIPTGHFIRDRSIDVETYDYKDTNDWKLVHCAEMKFNRLVFYPGDLFHAIGTPYFGDVIENSRLTQNVFINLA